MTRTHPDRARLKALPKVELHCHLDGSLRVGTILELARERSIPMPARTSEDLAPFVTVAPTCRSLKEFLDVFDLLYPLLRDAAAVERIAYELCEDCAEENIRHVEVRFAPALQAHGKFPAEEVVEATLRGLRRGLKDFGVSSGVILCLFRSHSPRENRSTFQVLKRLFSPKAGVGLPGVVGMDLAGDEARFPTVQFSDFYEEARGLGIPTTCHAGETVGTENLRAALDLRVRRIGHGTHLGSAPELMAEVVRRRLPLEIGLTSNVRTRSVPSMAEHPALSFHRAGVPITLNTDDRGIIGIDLTHEYLSALELGFSFAELRALSLGAVEHLFLPEEDRRALRKALDSRAAASESHAG